MPNTRLFYREPNGPSWNLVIKASNSRHLFGNTHQDGYFHTVRALTPDLVSVWSFSKDLDKRCQIVFANDQYVVVAHPYLIDLRSFIKTNFYILSASTGQVIFEFSEKSPYSSSGDFRNAVGYEHWVHRDFIFVLVGDNLKIWHILTGNLLREIPLELLFGKQDDYLSILQFNDNNRFYKPILHVDIQGKELHVFLQHASSHSLRIVKFDLTGNFLALPAVQIKPLRYQIPQPTWRATISNTIQESKVLIQRSCLKVIRIYRLFYHHFRLYRRPWVLPSILTTMALMTGMVAYHLLRNKHLNKLG